MSGHSKWSTIKRKKGAVDAKRGRMFTKLSKEITVSARMGGGDPDGNPRLRLAIQAAKAQSMPNDNIARALKKGTGELEGGHIEEHVYEGYGPGGVAFIVEVATDNTNRSLSDVRNIFEKSGGNMAKSGAVAFLFARRGMIRFDLAKHGEDEVMVAALEAGADDVVVEGEQVVVYTEPTAFHAVSHGLEAAGLVPEQVAFTMIPNTTVQLADVDVARKTLRLLDRLEDNDDVQNVWANFELPDAVLARLEDE
jgi:YebC/PmpR family DNA-binding regulatory protein